MVYGVDCIFLQIRQPKDFSQRSETNTKKFFCIQRNMDSTPLMHKEEGFVPRKKKGILEKTLNFFRISAMEDDLIRDSRVLRYFLMHDRVVFESTSRPFAFAFDVQKRKLFSTKKTLCEEVKLDTADDRKAWFKGVDTNGCEFWLKLTMTKAKLMSGGKHERFTFVVQ
nr:hypothetical protein MarFTME_209 [Marseillevirus futianmevirus]